MEKQHFLKIFHQNIQSFSSKTLVVELFLEKNKYDIVCLTEHWLADYEMLINYDNYCIASSFNRKSDNRFNIGGGSLILMRKTIKFKARKDVVALSVERSVEVSCVELDSHVIVCVYRPPCCQNFSTFENVMEDILKLTSRTKKHVIVCGDFNVDILKADNYTVRILSLFQSFNLNHVFLEPTRVTSTSSTCIDNFVCNSDYTSKLIINALPSDHSGLEVIFPAVQSTVKVDIQTRPITSDRLEKFNNVLTCKLPTSQFDLNNANNFYAQFFSIISTEYDKIFQVRNKSIGMSFKFSDWATTGIRKSRERLFELYEIRNYRNSDKFNDYVKNYSKTFKQVCLTAKANHISNKIKTADNKIKAVWNIINNETGKIKQRDSNFVLNSDKGPISSNIEVAQEFENFFANIPIKTTAPLNSSASLSASLLEKYVEACDAEFKFKHVDVNTIIKAFREIKVKGTEDLWGMSVKVCSSVIDTLAPYLAFIFNTCVDEGVFPDLMKYSKVIPLFKTGDKGDPSNFRPVSILPVLSKIFEKIILNQLLSHFNINCLLHNQQFGFTKGRSTTDAGVALIKHIFSAWEDSCDAIGVFCDLSKAFDCVHHDTLLLKLKHYGIKNNALKLLKSYLDNRIQKIHINGTKSQGSLVKIGVPQGSILGPFLFLVYINDLPYVVENLSNIVLFADDTSLIFKITRKTPDYDNINNTLQQIHSWFTANNLVLNAKKTKCIKFTLPNVKSCVGKIVLNNERLDLVDSTVFLGITIDAKLQWGPHISSLSGRLSSAAYAVRRIRQLTDIATARLVYFSYFHSIMSYGILLWGRAADVDSIFILQKRAIRSIYQLRCRDSLRELFKVIDILTVPCQYIFENIMYVRKNIHEFSKYYNIHNRNTRNKNKLVHPHCRLAKVSTSFVGLCVRYYNKIPYDILGLSEKKFKCYVKQTLCKKAYYKLDDYLNDKESWSSDTPA